MTLPQPAKGPPERVVLEGRWCRLEPLASNHAGDLYDCSSDGSAADRYRYLFDYAPTDPGSMAAWVEAAAAREDMLYFAVIDRASGRTGGRQSLMRFVPNDAAIEIGGIYWGPDIARTRITTEAVYLSARYVFDDLRYRRFEWKCNNLNEPSKRAALRFGFEFEGVFRQHMIQKGENRDTAWFAMLDADWPRLRREYERWLAPENFDGSGRQETKLRFG